MESAEPIPEHEVTRLLDQVRESPDTFDRIIPLVYDDLKRIGHVQRQRFNAGPTVQTTALVHEAFLKLRRHTDTPIENRLHFQRLAAMVMRQLIADYARRRLSEKRGGQKHHTDFEPDRVGHDDEDASFVMAVESAMRRMEQSDRRMAEVSAARFFAGYTIGEIAEMLELSPRTVSRDLKRARAWLRVELEDHAKTG